MPPPQIFSLDGHAFGLTVNGVQIIDKVPTDLYPIRWSWPSATNNGDISFTVEDNGETALPLGAVIRFTDNANNELLFSGPLTNVRHARAAGPWRHSDVTGTGWGFYADNYAIASFPDLSSEFIHDVLLELFSRTPVLPEDDFIDSAFDTATLPDQTISKVTVRSAVDTIVTLTATPVVQFYVDNDRLPHVFASGAAEASAVGTATSIGDEGSLIPERLVYGMGGETYKGFAHVYDSGGTAQGVAPNTAYDWEAPEPSVILDEVFGPSDHIAAATKHLNAYQTSITSITFTTDEDSSFRPHQEITIDDSLLTGGTAETFYVADVSGTIDDRNVIELDVSIGARARSFVQDATVKWWNEFRRDYQY